MKTCLREAARNVRSSFRAHAVDQHLIDHAEGSGKPQPLVTRLLVRSLNRTDGHPIILERAERIARNAVYFEQFADAVKISDAAARASGRSPESEALLRRVGDAFADMGHSSGTYMWNNMIKSLPPARPAGPGSAPTAPLLPLSL